MLKKNTIKKGFQNLTVYIFVSTLTLHLNLIKEGNIFKTIQNIKS